MINEETEIQDFIPQDTKVTQIQSLCAFMEQLGYRLHVDGKFYCEDYFEYFNKVEPTFKGCRVISFNTAVRLHNSWWDSFNYNFKAVECESFPEGSAFRTDAYTYNKAKAAKIVNKVFLQCTKHGRVVCNKHLVKFTYYNYHYMFLE